jgi:hypothetical protein
LREPSVGKVHFTAIVAEPPALKTALITAFPGAKQVICPALNKSLFTIATNVLDDFQLASRVTSRVLPSLSRAVACNWILSPVEQLTLAGATESETTVAPEQLAVAELVCELRLAMTVAVPTAEHRSSELLIIAAIVGSDELSVASSVRAAVLPSLSVAMTASGCVLPTMSFMAAG